MPNRIIKESICTSEKIASLSDFEFRLWVGLITQADDAGRGDARPAIIKGRVFPFRDRIANKDIDAALHGLAGKGCVGLYTVDGKPYFYFPTWTAHQRIRDCKPKYPEPPADNPPQSAASCGELRQSAASCGELRQSAASCGELRQSAASCGELRQSAAIIQSNPNPNPNPESESKARTRAPTLEEIEDYCREKGLNVDPGTFFEYFNTPNDRGETWVDSKGNKVKNWKQKLLTWESHGGGRKATPTQNRFSHLEQMYQAALEEESAKI